MIELAPDPIDPAELLRQFTAAAAGTGAIVSFTGLVRPDGAECRLWLDHHERLTIAAMQTIAAEACRRFALADFTAVHRVGDVGAGEPIVFVAAAARHRRPAFDAVDFALDQLKGEVPLWKCETSDGTSRWIEPRAEDHADAARWDGRHG